MDAASFLLLQQVIITSANRDSAPLPKSEPREENGPALSIFAAIAIIVGVFSIPISVWIFS